MAVYLLVAVSSYLRPNTQLQAKRSQLVAPMVGGSQFWSLLICPSAEGKVTKTFESDVSLELDTPWLLWAAPVLHALSLGDPNERILDFSYSRLALEFQRSCSRLGIEKLVLYQTRHSGASIDQATRFRLVDGIRTEAVGALSAH